MTVRAKCITAARNVELARFTRVGIGGVAQWFVPAVDEEMLGFAAELAADEGLPLIVLGAGSNVVISDGLVPAVVLQLRGERFTRLELGNSTVRIGAALMMPVAGRRLAEAGYAGIEFLTVIPGMVGGGVHMNAGTTNEGEIKDYLVSAETFNPQTRTFRNYSNSELAFGNRVSALQRTSEIVLSAQFDFGRPDHTRVTNMLTNVRRLQSTRKAKQPLSDRTFGSVFKRPFSGEAAGWYLERAGLRGLRVGGAAFSDKHANWIVNIDNATAKDVKTLLETGQRRVLDEFGVRLQREVIYFPEDLITPDAEGV